MAKANRIRIKLKAFDHKLLDRSAQKIVETAEQNGARVANTPTRVLPPSRGGLTVGWNVSVMLS